MILGILDTVQKEVLIPCFDEKLYDFEVTLEACDVQTCSDSARLEKEKSISAYFDQQYNQFKTPF